MLLLNAFLLKFCLLLYSIDGWGLRKWSFELYLIGVTIMFYLNLIYLTNLVPVIDFIYFFVVFIVDLDLEFGPLPSLIFFNFGSRLFLALYSFDYKFDENLLLISAYCYLLNDIAYPVLFNRYESGSFSY